MNKLPKMCYFHYSRYFMKKENELLKCTVLKYFQISLRHPHPHPNPLTLPHSHVYL